MSADYRACARAISFGMILLASGNAFAQPSAMVTSSLRSNEAVPHVSSSEEATKASPATLRDILGDTPTERRLEQSLSPYLTVAGTDRSLLEPLPRTAAGGGRQAYSLGNDMVVMAPASLSEETSVTLPEGHWVNFWTGAQSMGGLPFTAELPAGRFPIWVRGGSVIERRTAGYSGYFEKRLKDDARACGTNCLIDLMPAFSADEPAVTKDADGRTLTRSSSGLAVVGKPARMTVRWRFTGVSDVRVNGLPVQVQSSPEGYYTSFDHTEQSTVEWTVRKYMPRSY